MEKINVLKTYLQLLKNPWTSRSQIISNQEDKLRKIIDYSYAHVPYYKKLFDEAGITPLSIQSLDDLSKVPITTKADLQDQPIQKITSCAFQLNNLVPEHTSGSSGRPFTVFFDRNFVATRNSLFLRTLYATGYRLGEKVLLLTGDYPPKKNKWYLRWDYASIQQSSEELLGVLNRSKPDLLYGCVTTLRLLAKFISFNSTPFHKPKRILATAESLDAKTRKLLESIFEAEVFDFYGLTEMGPVGWECGEHNGYHISEDSVILEFLPIKGYEGEGSRLVMTNLNLIGMPLIRFETGDIGSPGEETACACGRNFALLKKVEGRTVDCVRRRDGRILSPYNLTCIIEKIPGLQRYQFIQEDFHHFILKMETGNTSISVSDEEIFKLLTPILGNDAQIEVKRMKEMVQQPGRKFRVVESKIKL